MATHPRDTFTELATIVGVSKATLHRIYGTRNDLEKLLLQQSDTIIQGIIRLANSDFNDYIDGLNQLIAAFYGNKELFRWLFFRVPVPHRKNMLMPISQVWRDSLPVGKDGARSALN